MAKAFFQIINKEKDPITKVNYLIKGIKVYDNYLRRNLNLQINTEKIYSRIICNANIKNEAINTISKSFQNDQDKLKPIESISILANIKETDDILIEESIGQRIKDLSVFFATIIGVIVAIIQYILPITQ